jgi:hypothetical protein
MQLVLGDRFSIAMMKNDPVSMLTSQYDGLRGQR